MKADRDINDRKHHHLELAEKAQVTSASLDTRFDYEPLLAGHPKGLEHLALEFLGKKLGAPLWISSMTGGTGEAAHINQNLAKVAREFKLGLGLGSCRPLLTSDEFFEDFNLRPILGDDLPFYANLGVAQVDQLLREGKRGKIDDMVSRLAADGLIIHLNPLQEWFQPEGDRFIRSPLETISEFCQEKSYKLIVKEVGQGMGPRSLRALCELPIDAIEFGAFGGTNFSKLEIMRSQNVHKDDQKGMSCVGHTASEMVHIANSIFNELEAIPQMIISGGVSNYLDGFYLTETYQGISVYGQAKAFLTYAAKGFEPLRESVKSQLEGLSMARSFLKVREESN